MFSPQTSRKKFGPEHNWLEIWTGRRTLDQGKYITINLVQYAVLTQKASKTFVVPEVTFEDIRDPDFTGGLVRPLEFLKHVWGDDRG